MERKLRIGVFGGARGNSMIQVLLHHPEAELVAVCDAYTHNPGDENCERLTFVAREHGKSAQNGYHGRIPEKPETHRAD